MYTYLPPLSLHDALPLWSSWAKPPLTRSSGRVRCRASRCPTGRRGRRFIAPSSSSASTPRRAPRPESTSCCATDFRQPDASAHRRGRQAGNGVGGPVDIIGREHDPDGGIVRLRDEIGRAHVWTPVTNAHLVCRLLLET